MVKKILNVASEKIDAELDRMGNKIPYFLQRKIYRRNKGQESTGGPMVLEWYLWQLFHKTNEKVQRGSNTTRTIIRICPVPFSDVHHDVGFILTIGYCTLSTVSNKHSRQLGLHAATVLAGR